MFILTHISRSCSSTQSRLLLLLGTAALADRSRRADRLRLADLGVGVSFHRPDCRLY